ncbi:MAG: hypothetical protein Q8R53_00535 [Nanoarchaeota archaeon]|nr:hypothetical protein [Nanoarchaeota archaeon]
MNYGKPSRNQPWDLGRAGIFIDKQLEGKPYFCLGKSQKNGRYGLFNEHYGVYALQEKCTLLDGREDVAVMAIERRAHTGAIFSQQFCYSRREEEHLLTAHVENRQGINNGVQELLVSQDADLSEPLAQYQVIHVPSLEEVVNTHLDRLSGAEENITSEIAQQFYTQLLREVPVHRWNFVRGIIC